MPARVGFTGVRAIATGEDVKGLLIGRKIYDLQAIKPKAPLLHPQVSGYRGLLHPCYIGGSFGGKGDFMDVPVWYLLSLKSGRPVKMVMDYSEEFVAGNPHHAAIVRVRPGSRKTADFLSSSAATSRIAVCFPAPGSSMAVATVACYRMLAFRKFRLNVSHGSNELKVSVTRGASSHEDNKSTHLSRM